MPYLLNLVGGVLLDVSIVRYREYYITGRPNSNSNCNDLLWFLNENDSESIEYRTHSMRQGVYLSRKSNVAKVIRRALCVTGQAEDVFRHFRCSGLEWSRRWVMWLQVITKQGRDLRHVTNGPYDVMTDDCHFLQESWESGELFCWCIWADCRICAWDCVFSRCAIACSVQRWGPQLSFKYPIKPSTLNHTPEIRILCKTTTTWQVKYVSVSCKSPDSTLIKLFWPFLPDIQRPKWHSSQQINHRTQSFHPDAVLWFSPETGKQHTALLNPVWRRDW